jgi:hypothetical protein
MVPPPARREDDDHDNNENKDNDDLSRDRRRAEGGEGNVDDGIDDEHVDGRVRGPRLADTGNGRRRILHYDGDNDNDVEEGGSHPTTPQTMVTCKLAERLRSAAATESGQRRKRATSTMVATTNRSTGVSGVRIGRILGMGDGGDHGATLTTVTTSRRADRIPPH